jgi:hypothetical protein
MRAGEKITGNPPSSTTFLFSPSYLLLCLAFQKPFRVIKWFLYKVILDTLDYHGVKIHSQAVAKVQCELQDLISCPYVIPIGFLSPLFFPITPRHFSQLPGYNGSMALGASTVDR